MLNTILIALALATAQAQTDTTFAVEPNGRLDVENIGGEVVVRGWDRNQVRVRATHTSRTRVTIRNTGNVVYLASRAQFGPGGGVEYEITVPRSFGVVVHGMSADTDVEGVNGDVEFRSVNGSAMVRGVVGVVRIETVGGAIDVADVRGNVNARTANRAITISRVRGDVSAETINGAVTLRDVTATSIQAGTMNGRVQFSGPIADNGRYSFASHNGPITLALPATTNATVFVAMFNGRFNAAFPVAVQTGGTDRRFSFVVGTGSARIEMESFNGNLSVVRP
jgi:hypothetical protein